jgi:NADH-ubiquinone oxidoreductase chain 5
MEGPTPVSALIHAATMVTAGVFLIIRCSPLFEYSTSVLVVVTFVGSLTAFFGASVGLVQNDIKKVIAYSTCSQLGYMVFSCGLSNYSASLYHLVNHAFFKALLFLSAGALIHGFGNIQDMRLMGNFVKIMPFTTILFVIGNLALIGFPFFSGAYSKDVIIDTAYIHSSFLSTSSYVFGLAAAVCTALYSTRLFYLVFMSPAKQYNLKNSSFISQFDLKNKHRGYNLYSIKVNLHDIDYITALPLAVLSFGSVFSGYLLQSWFSGNRLDFFKASLFTSPENLELNLLGSIPFLIKLVPTILVFFSVIFLLVFYTFISEFFYSLKQSSSTIRFFYTEVYNFLTNAWYFNLLYDRLIMRYGFTKSKTIFRAVDEGFLEVFGSVGLINILYACTVQLRKLFTGNICDYIIFMVSSLFIFIFIIL